MFVLRGKRLLWLLVMLVITPVITLPWNTIGKTIAQAEEDDDAGADDGETITLCAPGLQHGRPPRLPPRREAAELAPPPAFVAHKARLRVPAQRVRLPQSTRVRLQI